MILELSDGSRIFYEVFGDENKPPVLVLNGIMMSTASWRGFVEEFTKHFRLILMDFRDQGQSSRQRQQYDISIHVSDVKLLLSQLSIPEINVIGLSYGGQVAQLLAIDSPGLIKTLVLANTPARITPYLSELGEAWKEAAKLEDGEKFFSLAIPFIYSDYFYNRNLKWLKERQKLFRDLLNKEWFEGFVRLASSNPNFDVVDKLSRITCPTLLICADRDIITPLEEMQIIHERIPESEMLIIHDAGHGAFLEKPAEFMTAIFGFILKNN
ncbi:MAG TPA: alpha/beta hydrolase [Mesotoga infera]|nr:alpha/beta hydrolase [Mesotoga sp.]HPD38827.1 alpha/beta hydrolase [Mesotoga infera]HRV02343.1 alpha/beta hydrolase [Mesotoga sp.]